MCWRCISRVVTLQTSLKSPSPNNNIKVLVMKETLDNDVDVSKEDGIYQFVLLNPRDSDDRTKALIQKTLDMYKEELPTMNYAANTGKQTKFLEKCVSNGKYCTLLLKTREDRPCQEVIAAITYQIIPSDTHHVEIPLAAVNSINQRKGIGCCLYVELKKRLRNVGIRTIYCWADQESEGFWIKQGFVAIGKVNTKGRTQRLPIKTEIRKSLCFPGGSTLMISHLHEESLVHQFKTKVLTSLQPLTLSADVLEQQPGPEARIVENVQPKSFLSDSVLPSRCSDKEHTSTSAKSWAGSGVNQCSCSVESNKRKWEASHSSLNTKKIKGGHLVDCSLDSTAFIFGSDSRKNSHCNAHSLAMYEKKSTEKETCQDLGANNSSQNIDEDSRKDYVSEHQGGRELQEMEKHFQIMLMDIADDKKKTILTKIIEDLGGAVTVEGSTSTHVISGKVRKTLNLCKALCSGAWILSPNWLKESFRAGRFIDELPFVLKDENYESKYKTELKNAVLRAKATPRALLKGYDICIAAGTQPPVSNLSAITKSAGGNVIKGLDNVKDTSKTIFVACEDHMDDALSAVKKGIRTFGSDWFINCIMRQELALQAPQFAESL